MKSFPNVKLNLGLNVLRKRPDGYHDLETLFVPYFGFNDVLEIVPSKDYRFIGEGTEWKDDITEQAYKLLQADFNLPPVEIRLKKGNPVGAGLGGGSSDGAFALKMLNELFSLSLSEEQLASYAARLGSDCPFFIYNRPMLASGRGEILQPYDLDLDGYEFKVEVPEGISVSTREAYAGIVPHLPEIPLEEVLSRPVEEWRNLLVNDFETSVFAAHPELVTVKRDFYAKGAVYAAMSGSGSAVFGIFKKQ